MLLHPLPIPPTPPARPIVQSRAAAIAAHHDWRGAVGAAAKSQSGLLTRVAFASLWLFIFTIPWENQFMIPSVGTLGRLMGLAACGLGLLAVVLEVNPRMPGLFHGLAAGFVVWSGMSAYWTISTAHTMERLLTNLQLLGMTLLIFQLARQRHQQISIMRAYVLGCLVSSVYTILNFLSGRSAVYERYAAAGFDPNDLGLILALSVAMSWYLSTVEQREGLAWLYRLYLVVAGCAILLTASRGALMATLLSLPFVLFTLKSLRPGQKAALTALAVVGIICVVSLVPAASIERLATISAEISGGTLNARRTLWQAGMDAWRDHQFVGIGAGAFRIAVERAIGYQQVAHNLFISVLAELGVVGLLLFLSLIAVSVRSVMRLPTLQRRLWLTVIATWCVGVLSLTWEWRKPTWLIFGLMAAWTSIQQSPVYLTRRGIVRRSSHADKL